MLTSSCNRDSECRCFERDFSLYGWSQPATNKNHILNVYFVFNSSFTQLYASMWASSLSFVVGHNPIVSLSCQSAFPQFIRTKRACKSCNLLVLQWCNNFSNISAVSVPMFHIIHWFLRAMWFNQTLFGQTFCYSAAF